MSRTGTERGISVFEGEIMGLGLFLEVRQEMKQKIIMECSLCGGNVAHRAQNKVNVYLFGAVKYGACPICLAEIEKKDRENRGFRRRWTLALKRKLGIKRKGAVNLADMHRFFGIK